MNKAWFGKEGDTMHMALCGTSACGASPKKFHVCTSKNDEYCSGKENAGLIVADSSSTWERWGCSYLLQPPPNSVLPGKAECLSTAEGWEGRAG